MPTRRDLLASLFATAALLAARRGHAADARSTFHAVYDDPALADRFFPFLVNVFHLVPEEAFHDLIREAVAQHADDEAIYRAIADGLDAITPFGATFTHAIPALRTQKQVLADQTAALLAGTQGLQGYVEIGTNGSYIEPVRRALGLAGPTWLLTDVPQTWHPAEMVQRGTLRPNAAFVPMGDYDEVPREAIPDGAAQLVSSYIGFHHAPPERLDGFLAGLHRLLAPGGRLILREHDVDDAVQHDIVALAHDVFNVGTHLTWADNHAQLRHFRSVDDWTTHLDAHGFRRDEGHELQEGDPTDNALLVFTRA